ncbi:hypothetical protein [Streptomyces sp. NPDC051577]|uniref:hypothetical protein n=1 Tax=Streptomyces sp. NPDC051577 TaxID=3155166 RepID=UPI003428A2FD
MPESAESPQDALAELAAAMERDEARPDWGDLPLMHRCPVALALATASMKERAGEHVR